LRVMEADDPALGEGFHGFEPDDGLRWTNGDAGLPAGLFAGLDGPMVLESHVAGTTSYPLMPSWSDRWRHEWLRERF
jgi:hypothetical protein